MRRDSCTFKRFSGRADAYYILAYHYKEFNNLKARKYFELANRKSGRKSMTKTKSQVALAKFTITRLIIKKLFHCMRKVLGIM